MWSASSPCPHASWNSTPPAPRLQHDRELPARRGHRVEQRERARAAAMRPTSSGVELVEELEAHRAAGRFVPGLHAGVAGRDALHDRIACAPGRRRRAARRSSRRGCGGARRRTTPSPSVIAPPSSRAAASARREQLDLARASRPSRAARLSASSGVARRRRVSATTCVPPPPPRAAPAAASAASRRPSAERSAVCANPVVSPRTTRKPGAAVATGDELLDAAVVEAARSTTAGPRRTPRRSHRRCAARGRASLGGRRVDHGVPQRARRSECPRRAGCLSYAHAADARSLRDR